MHALPWKDSRLRFEDHAKIRSGLDFGQGELSGQRKNGRLRGRQIGLGCGQSFDLGKGAKTLGPVERDLEGAPRSVHLERSPFLANRRGRSEAQELEEMQQLTGGLLSIGEPDLDLLAGLGGAWPARS